MLNILSYAEGLFLDLLGMLALGYLLTEIIHKYKKQEGQRKRYKVIYLTGYLGITTGMAALLYLIHCLNFYMITSKCIIFLWILITLGIPISIAVTLIAQIGSMRFNRNEYGVVLPDAYSSTIKKFYACIVGCVFVILILFAGCIEVYIDKEDSPFIRNGEKVIYSDYWMSNGDNWK